MNNNIIEATSTFKSNAKTFSFAAKLLNKKKYEAVARLYAFCRYIDDLADDNTLPGSNDKKLNRIRQDIIENQTDNTILKDVILLKKDYKIPTSIFLDFIDGIIADQHPRELESVDHLVRFAYGVASTVGLMMCYIFDVRNTNAFPFAIDLGIAMQMSNACRDILEDAKRGRIYLPKELLNKPVTCNGIINGDSKMRDSAYKAAKRVLILADQYYASAALGYGYLPRSVRYTIKIAARLYQAIGEKIINSPNSYWQERSIVPKYKKIYLIFILLWKRMHEGSSTKLINKVTHCSNLHKALEK
ncbi:MAG: phytoene synthase [Gammaproteobacteria bacterium]|nr:phytoene synthase [Gammaproteobacteria bacterium]|tara:strand:+ start:307 stop:1212 length:906 start_codon:yes stop_codon:yes gene_type:complete